MCADKLVRGFSFDARGRELNDQTPVEVPIAFRGLSGDSLRDQVRRLVAEELSTLATGQGFESFSESDDFGEDDSSDFLSPYELSELQEESGIADILLREEQRAASGNDTAGPPVPSEPDEPATGDSR